MLASNSKLALYYSICASDPIEHLDLIQWIYLLILQYTCLSEIIKKQATCLLHKILIY